MLFRVALVVPQSSLKLASDCSPPLGLAFLASYLRKHVDEVEIKIFDGVAGCPVLSKLVSFMPDVVGITATTPQIKDAYTLASHLRKVFPNVVIVFGGPHVSVLPDEALSFCDYVVVDEGEVVFTDVVRHVMEFGKPLVAQKIVGYPVDDLDDLPPPAYDLLDMSFYLSRRFLEPLMLPPVLGLVTSRGCPYHCVFCYNSGRASKVRYFSAKRVVEELLLLHEHYGVCNFFFQDDEFLINRSRLEELAILFRQFGVDGWIKWGCQARVTSLNSDVLTLVESMGCVLIVPGMESFNPRILKYLKAGSVEQSDLVKAVKLFEGSRIVLMGNFIVGCPSESLEEMWESVAFFVGSPSLVSMIVNVLTPYPGTVVWRDCGFDGLDYARLVPTYEGSFNVASVPEKLFNYFLRDVGRICFVVRSVRFRGGLRGFFGLWRAKSWWWMWLFYPEFMLELFWQSLVYRKHV